MIYLRNIKYILCCARERGFHIKLLHSPLSGSIALGILLILPFFKLPITVIIFFFLLFIYITLSEMWNLLAGYSGLVSLGIPAFMGIGAYSVAILDLLKVNIYIAIFCGGLASGLLALICLPLLRMKGIYFSVGTLVLTVVLQQWFTVWVPVSAEGRWIGGGAGYYINTYVPLINLYFISIAIGSSSVLLLYTITKSKLGLILMAMRDDEKAAVSLGVNPTKLKIFCFIISSFMTGLSSGALFTYIGRVDSNAFSIPWLGAILTASILGARARGIENVEGPIIGSIIVTCMNVFLTRILYVNYIIQGSIIAACILFEPGGLVNFLRKVRTRL